MKTSFQTIKPLALLSSALVLALVATSAPAEPLLQLDIKGGTYYAPTETIVAPSSNTFELYAYGLSGSKGISLSDNFFLSMALLPATQTNGSYGFFKINGTTVNVTSDMVQGTPPIDTVLAGQGFDPGDLSKHSIFPTYFAEKKFNFSSIFTSGVYNTQDHAGLGPQSGTGMYYAKFDIDLTGLGAGHGIHFDLYNETLITKKSALTDIDVNKFAPYSHDAEGTHVTVVPEPETYAMLLAGLGLLGFMARRRKQKEAA